MAIQGYKPVFPIPGKNDKFQLSVHEYFAAMAMQGILAGLYATDKEWTPKQVVEDAIKCADALVQGLPASS